MNLSAQDVKLFGIDKMDTRYYQIGGFTLEVNSELPFRADTFNPPINQFEVKESGKENIVINHYFERTIQIKVDEQEKIYFKRPWAVYEKKDKILYEWIRNYSSHETFLRKIVANKDHTKLDIYHDSKMAKVFLKGGLQNISLLPSDQLLFSRVLGYKQGCLLHSTGLVYKNNGYIFVGHSGAGKTTIAKIMEPESIILCDDRNIIRRSGEDYYLFGTWRHSDFAVVSPLSAQLKGIFFLNKSKNNKITKIIDNKKCFFILMDCLIRSLVTHDWMELTIDFIDSLSRHVDCFDLEFDKSGKVMELIKKL
jgi:hypothetical protein